jgi:homocitrate synthase NifV
MNIEQKLQVARLLAEAGNHQIEAEDTSYDDYEIEAIRRIVAQRKKSKITVWNRIVMEDIKNPCFAVGHYPYQRAGLLYADFFQTEQNKAGWLKPPVPASNCRIERFEVTVASRCLPGRHHVHALACLQLKDLGVARVRYADNVGVLTPTRALRTVRRSSTIPP